MIKLIPSESEGLEDIDTFEIIEGVEGAETFEDVEELGKARYPRSSLYVNDGRLAKSWTRLDIKTYRAVSEQQLAANIYMAIRKIAGLVVTQVVVDDRFLNSQQRGFVFAVSVYVSAFYYLTPSQINRSIAQKLRQLGVLQNIRTDRFGSNERPVA